MCNCFPPLSAQCRDSKKSHTPSGLSVGPMAAVAHAKDAASVTVELADEARVRVQACSDWIIDSVANGGDIYGVTTGFGDIYEGKCRQ
ncbi:unnamed protein product [Triticum turgidum subsp. durum]|uniref:Phenylalanine ammonia-lyase n=1 Tax=Triticum turgidum subsp. durum TaxID=4567 RepID=A0A9R0TDM2_TRITD|nr:unnamed protein product [Triticum turgidum subsp. durum]